MPHLANIDFLIWEDKRVMASDERAIDLTARDLSEKAVNDIVAFLRSLAGKSAKPSILGILESVPSGFPIDRMSSYTTN